MIYIYILCYLIIFNHSNHLLVIFQWFYQFSDDLMFSGVHGQQYPYAIS